MTRMPERSGVLEEAGRKRRLLTGLLLLAAGSALLSLPAETFPRLWLALFCLPGALFHRLSLGRLGAFFGFSERTGLALLLQVSLAFLLLHFATDTQPEAALTYTLIPPLTYVTLRRGPVDRLLSLFLGFCLLLIGVMLSADFPATHLLLYATSATLVLQGDALELVFSARNAVRAARKSWFARACDRSVVSLACLLAALGIFELLQLTPQPRLAAPSSFGGAMVGLSPEFDLKSNPGNPLNLVGDRLLRVRARKGKAVPPDLYLRGAYFDVAGVDRWRVRRSPVITQRSSKTRWRLRTPLDGLEQKRLRIRRFVPAAGFVFIPPGTFLLSTTAELFGRQGQGYLHERHARGPIDYTLAYQDRNRLASGRAVSRGRYHLRQLPPGLRKMELWRQLAFSWTEGSATDAVSIARALAAGLQSRCSYRLEEPSGPHRHAIENFLFGNRTGYCMHFSSALAIMLRMRGIPCRIAVGLYGGERGGKGERLYGSRHAHAWVEIPFLGLGWVVVDPTPPANLDGPGSLLPGRSRAPREGLGKASDRDGRRPIENPDDPFAALAALPLQRLLPWLALLVLLVGTTFLPLRRRPKKAHEITLPTEARSARRQLGKILHTLARRGAVRMPGQTLSSYLRVLQGARIEGVEPIGDAFGAYLEVRFGARPFDSKREERMRTGMLAAHALAKKQ